MKNKSINVAVNFGVGQTDEDRRNAHVANCDMYKASVWRTRHVSVSHFAVLSADGYKGLSHTFETLKASIIYM